MAHKSFAPPKILVREENVRKVAVETLVCQMKATALDVHDALLVVEYVFVADPHPGLI